ncbi:MAG: ribbon-helix-helix protein, CopG family [Candidatus Peregrinibacteria bacterium]|nr:ribbon-helix-helix protein, CopG family [Candidatus Peregrinibacteria bacterium]MDZ4245192.1 ribbon-helix-helix protein, CopG family [Candidatus Gracilibacteria bacterium]
MKKVHTQNKFKISVTILPSINAMLDQLAENMNTSKSSIVEAALRNYIDQRLEQEAKELSKITCDDLPSEDEWLLLGDEISF